MKQIRFSKQVADRNDSYVHSVTKSNEYKVEIQIQRSVKAGVREFFKNREFVINLVLNMGLWALTDMNYQINDYYNNFFPGDTFEDTIAIATVELFGYIFAMLVYEYCKSKKSTRSYLVSYAICIVASTTLLANDKEAHPYIDLTMDFLAKFGIASAFQSAFLSNDLFPVVFSSTTFGVCSMMTSISSVLSVYEVYTQEGTSAWLLFLGLCIVGVTLCLLQREK